MVTSAQETNYNPTIPNVPKRSCFDCGHLRICSVFRTISPYLQEQFTDKTKPFEAVEIAQICKAYIDNSTLALLEGMASR